MQLKRIDIKTTIINNCLFIIIAILLLPLNISAGNIEKNIPFSTMVILNRAQTLVKENNIPKAINELEKFKHGQENNKRPVHPVLFFTLGNCYMEENKTAAAVLSYESALEEAKDFTPAWINLARAYYDLKKFKRAGECFINGYERSEKKRSAILYYAANAFFAANDYPKALETFNRISIDPSGEIEPIWHELIVHILLELKKPEKALPHMEFLVKKLDGKQKTQWQETLLYHYMTLKMDTKALEMVLSLTYQYPLEPRWWKGLARFYLDKNQFKDALAAMTVYSYLTPLGKSEKQLVADLNLQVGIPVKAVDLYQELAKKKSTPEIYEKIVASFQQMNLYDMALEASEQGIKDNNTNVGLKMIRGNLLFTMKRYEEAAEEFKSLVNDDKSGRAWLMLGHSLWNLGEIESAHKAMEKAATFKNQKQAATRALKNIPPF